MNGLEPVVSEVRSPRPGPAGIVGMSAHHSTSPALVGITRKLAADSPKAYRIVLTLLALITLELAVAISLARCPAINSMMCDVSTLLDGGYRVLLGQRPHVDFYSPLGLFFLISVAGGIKIAGLASAFAYVHALLLLLLVPWTWSLLCSRTSALLAGAAALWVGVLAVTPRSIGFPPPMITYSMQYNRWGWALLAIACLELFLPRRDSGKTGVAAGVSTGVAAGLLLFLKVNYFAAVVLAILVRLVLSGVTRKWLAGAAGSFLGVAGAGFWYLHFDFAAFAGDLRLLAAVQSFSARLASMVQLTAANLPDLWCLGGAMLITALCLRPPATSPMLRLRLLAAPAAVAALGILTCSANYQVLQIPLIYVAIFLLVEQLRRGVAAAGDCGRMAFLAVCLIATGMAGNLFYEDVATLAAAGAKTTEPAPPDWPRLDAALGDVRIDPPPRELTTDAVRGGLRAGAVTWREEEEAYPYVLWFNDGAALLRAHVSPRSRVLVLDLSNPFSFGLGLTPPRGDALFWHYQRDFDSVHYPAPSRVFREVTHVMVPKAPINRSATAALQRIYAPVLARDFRLAAESELWILYERRSGSR